MLLLTALAVLLAFVELGFTVTSKAALDIATGQAEGELLRQGLILAGLLAVQLLTQVSITLINVRAQASLEMALKNRIFDRLMKKRYLSLTAYHSGDILNRMTSDAGTIAAGVVGLLPEATLLVTSLLVSVVYLFTLDRFLAAALIILGPCLIGAAQLYSRRYKSIHKQCQETEGRTRSFIQEILRNVLVVKAFGGEEEVLSRTKKLQLNNFRARMRRAKVSVVSSVGMFLVYNAGYYAALAYGAWRLAMGAFTFGTVTAVLQLVGRIQTPVKNISGLIPQYFAITASAERLLELEDMPDEKGGGELLAADIRDMQSIVFDRVCFSYDKAKTMEYDLRINRGETVVIAGESGAGKSTLIKLLLGIIEPASGSVYIDCGDRRIAVGERSRGLFSYVPQGNLILSGTIRENIAFASGGADAESIIRAAKTAAVWDFIATLPHGLDTRLGEGGLGLSEGQAQRISIARAVLHDAPVILLDEATSALDAVTEEQVLSNIRALGDKTCIAVSHRSAAFAMCDRVIRIG